jgi:hypothetical protein
MPAVQYPGMENSFGKGSFVGANQDLSQMFAAQRNEQLNQQKALADQQFEAQQRPITLANDALGFQEKLRNEDLAQTLYQQKKDNAVAAERAKAATYDLPQVEKFGNGLLQLGTMAKQNGGQLPLWMKSQVPDSLWQDLHSEGGADRFISHGKAIVENKDKFISQESKQNAAQGIADTKADTAAELEAGRNARAAAANALKQRLAAEHTALVKSGSKDPTKWEALATKYAYIANDPNRSPEERDVARQNAINAANMQAYFIALAANAKNVGTTDVGKVSGLPTVQEKPMPNPTGPSKVKKDAQGRILLD